jgi:glycogen debranching enzyme
MADGSTYHIDASTPIAQADEVVTLVAGTAFCVLRTDGEIEAGGSQGYYTADTRMLSLLRLRFDGAAARVLQHDKGERTLSVLGMIGDPVSPRLLVRRVVELTDRLVVDVEIENLVSDPVVAHLDVTAASDFADLFEVKRGEIPRSGFVGSGPRDGRLVLAYENDSFRRSVTVRADRAADVLRDGLHLGIFLDGHGYTAVRVAVEPSDGASPTAAVEVHRPTWHHPPPELHTSLPGVADVWRRSCADLETLLLPDPDEPDRTIIAAGSPWFMALFGRDSLISSWQALVVDTGLAVGTLHALADRQGTRERPDTAEQPGRILHEVRRGEAVRRTSGWGEVYYGSVDATPLFVMALAEAWRWGAPADDVRALIPAAERAVAWITDYGDSDGDGFVEYPGRVASGAGLANQAWKDSDDAVRHPDGSIAAGPITMVEVQGYCHAALRAMAALHEAFGTGDPAPLVARAGALQAAIEDQFWMDDEDCYAMALDGNDRPVRSVSTNAGHLLWTGTASPERAARLAKRLLARDMFTGFGLRTLSAANRGYNPLSYHCGSVWPHDTAIVASGMLRYGLAEEGARVARALIETAACENGQLPELFGGFDRERFARPVPYQSACSPQAWAAGAPLLLVRSLLGLDPDLPGGVVRLLPCLDDVLIELIDLRLGTARTTVRASGRVAELHGLPDGVRLDTGG